MSYRKYVLHLLFEIGKLGAKPCSTSMMPSLQLLEDNEPFKEPKRYRRLVRKIK